MEIIDKNRLSSPMIYNDTYSQFQFEEEPNYIENEPPPASSLPTNLGPLRDSFEETTFGFETANRNREPSKNYFDASFQRANEINRRKDSNHLLNENKNSLSSEIDESEESVTCPAESVGTPQLASRNSPPAATQKRHTPLTAQVSFSQAAPIEHEYPPTGQRRHFTFGARTYSEEQRAQLKHNSRRSRFSRQKTVRYGMGLLAI